MKCRDIARRSFCKESSHRDESIYASPLRQCCLSRDLANGKRIHSELRRLGSDRHTLLGTLLVQMYGRCGCVADAVACFDSIRNPTAFSHNVMVAAYAQNGHLALAARTFDWTPNKDVVSWNGMLSAYARYGSFRDAKLFFDEMPYKNTVSYNTLISAFARQGNLAKARNLFNTMKIRDAATWNVLIAGYTQRCLCTHAREIFDRAPVRNVVTWNTMVAGYAQAGHLDNATELFGLMPQWNEVCWNALISGMGRNHRLPDALELFQALPFRDMVSWIAMIQGCVHSGDLHRAWDLFKRMPLTDVVIWTAIVTAFAHSGFLQEARDLFEAIPIKDAAAVNAMIAAYGLHGEIARAKDLFDSAGDLRDVISWNALLAAFSQNGHARQALGIFAGMDLEGIHPDGISFVSALDACTILTALREGKLLHEELLLASQSVFVEASLATALVNFYAKCGRLDEARSLFDAMAFCDAILLNAMLGAYAQSGRASEAADLFQRAILSGIHPDAVTFVSIVSACSHAGLLDLGHRYFLSLVGDFALAPHAAHYTCMVDLLARTGQLMDGEDLLDAMPFQPEYTAWKSLLAGCRTYGDVGRGARLAHRATNANPVCSSPYVLLSRLYDAAGKHGDGISVRKAMDARRLRKPAGLSSITIKGRAHEFVAGGKNHPEISAILDELHSFNAKMREAGYVPDTSNVLHDFDDEEKEQSLSFHSEKLAVVFGMISTRGRSDPLFVVKNLRMCTDCHTATKFMSRIAKRAITVRDAHRFHHFQDGACACADFW
ncbi:pentatricopeptide repeat-containing protein At4g02750 [Selaginella moellendorffii]|nr:pentatricopeptide repeat-containing protein At4g02750 [Selaginella moellendorffii]|eukprot:XP_002988301.2 pentatricopeptide repeat-containing protein At4g02750 [Selaginella moellendorffii]